MAALCLLVVVPKRPRLGITSPAPAWAYLGGMIGVVIVLMGSEAVNSPLALSGTLTFGLAGQVLFSLIGDRWGLFGLSRRRLGHRDFLVVVLITSGSLILVLVGRGMT